MSAPFDDDPFSRREQDLHADESPEREPELDVDPEPDADSVEQAAENVLGSWHAVEREEEADVAVVPAHPEPLAELPHPDDAPAIADHVSSDTAQHAPGELVIPPGYPVLDGVARGERRAVGIVVSRFNGEITSRLLASALAELERRGVIRDAITVMPVPGAFELPVAAMALAKTRRFACIVALGCVIRGDTPHFDYVAAEAASGLQLAAIETGVPVAFGVLTLERVEQADPRIDHGADAVISALEMADVFSNLRAAAAR